MTCTIGISPSAAERVDDTATAAWADGAVGPSDATGLVQLVRRSGSGQQNAFTELYEVTSARIYGVVLRVLRSPDQAIEVTQEVYVEVWQQAGRFSPAKGSVLAWMTTVAHRRAVDRVRSITSAAARERRHAIETVQPAYDDVWSAVQQRVDAERVRRGLASLTPIQREAVVLAYFGGYTQAQIARRLDIPLGTVKTRIRDGLSRLREALRIDGDEE